MDGRVKLSLLCFVVALGLGLPLGWQVLSAYRNPEPLDYKYTSEANDILEITASRTRFMFPGDCVLVTWKIYHAQEVILNEHPYEWIGERNLCDGEPAYFTMVLQSNLTHELFIPRTTVFDSVWNWVLMLGMFICMFLGVLSLTQIEWAIWQKSWMQYLGIAILIVVFLVWLELFTNSMDIVKFTWDHVHYIEMATYGVGHDYKGLVAPFAYRPLPPLLAGFLGEYLGRSVIAGFRFVAYVGIFSQLFLVFAFAKIFTNRFFPPFVATCVVAFSLFNIKFVLYSIYYPDALAYSLMLLASMALIKRRFGLMLIMTGIGFLVREFMILPVLMLCVILVSDYLKTKQRSALVWLGLTVITTVLAIVIPRSLIIVARSSQSLDVNGLMSVLDISRNVNIMYALVSYFLPTVLLIGVYGWEKLWSGLKQTEANLNLPLRWCLSIYLVGFIGLVMIGGTDIMRFMSYALILQVIFIVLLTDVDDKFPIYCILIIVFVFNRIYAPIPTDSVYNYLSFYGGWSNVIYPNSLVRMFEMFSYGVLVWVLFRRRTTPKTKV
jgi:hypothetical protein